MSEIEKICDNCKGEGKIPVRGISVPKGHSISEIMDIELYSDAEIENRIYTAFEMPCQKCKGIGKIKV